ncbi:MAG: hypothetical protein GKR89_29105 [Candidatus Latescibacteria bacterium]|nr:hypothetical protein [Candidatus Latescibacterota bacterium]
MSATSLRDRLKNVHAYAPTPFAQGPGLPLDLDGMERNLEFLIEAGVQVVNIGGGTGENNALSTAELEALARRALEVAGERILVVPSLPGNFGMAAELIGAYAQMGAQIVLGMAPFIRDQRPDEIEGVWRHYRGLADLSPLPLMPYNTQNWPVDFFVRLAAIDSIVAIKDPCLDPHPLFRAIQQLGERFVWVGNKRHDPGVLHLRYQAGIEGFTAGFVAFMPRFELALHEAALRQDWSTMVDIQAQLAPLEPLRNQHGDGLIKAGLDLVGLAGGPVRPPRTDVGPAGLAALRAMLEKLDALKS